jgi:RNA polymerase sigma-70 factor (ECF subfamily)
MTRDAVVSAVLCDAELVRGARAGDGASIGLLLQRHEAGMRAVALSILGMGADAEDALQDAALTAVRRIGGLRDPALAGPWLRAIVRNCCLMQLRSRRDLSLGAGPPLVSGELTPEQILERHALRDWIWHAIEDLSPALRMTVMLRHFSEASAYEDIAAACEVPVGTVRSRLSQARAKLTAALRETADAAHADAGSLAAGSRAEAIGLLAAADRGEFGAALADRWVPELEFVVHEGRRLDRRSMIGLMDRLVALGIRQRLVSAVPSRDLTIWEMDITNPPDHPGHCPAGVIWLLSLRAGRIRRLRLFHPRRMRAAVT